MHNVTRAQDSILRVLPTVDCKAGLGLARAIKLPDDVSLKVFRQALASAVQENESLRIRIVEDHGAWKQEVLGNDEDQAEYFPKASSIVYSASHAEFSEDVSAWVNDCQNQCFHVANGKVFISSSFESDTGETWCYLSVHPAVADSHTIDALWGRLAVLTRQLLTNQQNVFVQRPGILDLLEAQRKTAGIRYSHTEFWLSNPRADLRNEDSEERILSQPDTSIAGRHESTPAVPLTLHEELAPEIKDLLVQAATRYGGTWEQSQLASIGSFISHRGNAPRTNIGYVFSNLLLFEDSAAWSDIASQMLCRSEVTLPVSIPCCGMGLEQMKQVKVQLDRIEDNSLVSQLDIQEVAEKNSCRAFGAVVDVREINSEIIMGSQATPLTVLSDGPIEDLKITVNGLADPQTRTTYQILANPNIYTTKVLKELIAEMMSWQYRWALAVLNKTPIENI